MIFGNGVAVSLRQALCAGFKGVGQAERAAGEALRQRFAVEPAHGEEALTLRRLAVRDVRDSIGRRLISND